MKHDKGCVIWFLIAVAIYAVIKLILILCDLLFWG